MKIYIKSMNDEPFDDIKKKFMLPLMIELQDHEEKVFHNLPVSHWLIMEKFQCFDTWGILKMAAVKSVEPGTILLA